MDALTSAFYAKRAGRLAADYIAVSPEFEARLSRVFEKDRRILDVGCGTGRDLGFLLKQGKDAIGVDASPAMLATARSALEANGLRLDGRLVEAALPDLSCFGDAEFDGVLCSAVLMHLAEDKIFDAVYALRRVLKPGGTLLVSVPASRSDVDPATRRDAHGRLFNDLPPAKIQLLFERVGFCVRESEVVADSLGRDGIQWHVIEFVRLDASADRPLHLVESILNRDKKDATYKLALFRALAEIAQTQNHLAAFTPEGKVKIPLKTIAEKWMLYYWPIFDSEVFIPQRRNEREGGALGVAIRKPLDALIGHFQHSGGLNAFYCDWKAGRLSVEAARLFKSARSSFQSVIHEMPAKHAGGGHYSVFQYDRYDRSLCMNVSLWRELCLMGSWISDATVLRWAELTEVFAKKEIKASLVIDRLLFSPDQGRNVSDAQRYFRSLSSRSCVWSQRPLKPEKFDVDHAMPFSYWRNNDLWNLFPAAPDINSAKRDMLPTYGQLRQSQPTIIGYWQGLNSALGERFEREAMTLLGRDTFQRKNWENLLFSRFVEAFEVTAAQRGAARWEMPGISASGVASEFQRSKPSPVRYPAPEGKMHYGEERAEFTATNIIPFIEVGAGAFKTHLPLIGALAAGSPFHGLEAGSLDACEELDWMRVPERIAKPGRFVVCVAGDSMETTLRVGDFVVFEYHRSPRRDHEIVIANLPEFGAGTHGTEAIKRITQDADAWIFVSDNPAYDPIRVPKSETVHPILGTMVQVLK